MNKCNKAVLNMNQDLLRAAGQLRQKLCVWAHGALKLRPRQGEQTTLRRRRWRQTLAVNTDRQTDCTVYHLHKTYVVTYHIYIYDYICILIHNIYTQVCLLSVSLIFLVNVIQFNASCAVSAAKANCGRQLLYAAPPRATQPQQHPSNRDETPVAQCFGELRKLLAKLMSHSNIPK